MKHRTKKFAFGGGMDADTMLMRKLMKNFLTSSRIVTTLPRAKALKILLDRLVYKTREYTQANKNYLLRYFPEKIYQRVLFEQIGPAVAKISGGYVRVVKLGERDNDGAMMARIEWAHPVVVDWSTAKKTKAQKKVKSTKEPKEEKSASKSKDSEKKDESEAKKPKKVQKSK